MTGTAGWSRAASGETQLRVPFPSCLVDDVRWIREGTAASPGSDAVGDGNCLFLRLAPVAVRLCCFEALIFFEWKEYGHWCSVCLDDDCV